MGKSLHQWFDRLQVDVVLEEHPTLRLAPATDDGLLLRGSLPFRVAGPEGEVIEDAYQLDISIARGFPDTLPLVRETGGRIPADFHKLEGGHLCLGSPTAVRHRLTETPTLPTLLRALVIPYLYGHSFYLKHQRMPYGELPHGNEGIREHLREWFGTRGGVRPEEFLRLASIRRRVANKAPCPCGSGRRLGRCHNRTVNRLRAQLGRLWFRSEFKRVTSLLADDEPIEPVRLANRDHCPGRWPDYYSPLVLPRIRRPAAVRRYF